VVISKTVGSNPTCRNYLEPTICASGKALNYNGTMSMPGSCSLANQEVSAALISGDLVLVGGEGCQDFGLLALRYLEEVQGPSELRCDLIEF